MQQSLPHLSSAVLLMGDHLWESHQWPLLTPPPSPQEQDHTAQLVSSTDTEIHALGNKETLEFEAMIWRFGKDLSWKTENHRLKATKDAPKTTPLMLGNTKSIIHLHPDPSKTTGLFSLLLPGSPSCKSRSFPLQKPQCQHRGLGKSSASFRSSLERDRPTWFRQQCNS